MLVMMQARFDVTDVAPDKLKSPTGNFPVATSYGPQNKSLQVKIGRRPQQTYTRLTPERLSADDLKGFTGEYFSEELQRKIRLTSRGNSLMLEQSNPFVRIPPLNAVGKDLFGSQIGIILKFQRDPSGKITGFQASTSRSRGVVFRRSQSEK